MWALGGQSSSCLLISSFSAIVHCVINATAAPRAASVGSSSASSDKPPMTTRVAMLVRISFCFVIFPL